MPRTANNARKNDTFLPHVSDTVVNKVMIADWLE